MIPSVLFYHQVTRERRADHYWLRSQQTVDQFRAAMTEVREHWHPLHVDEFVWIHNNGRRWPKRSVLITFDDGFKNNLWAAEVLHELGMSALIFVISGVVGTDYQPWYVRFAQVMSTRKRDQWTCPWGEVDYGNSASRRRWLKATKEHLLSLRPDDRDQALSLLATAVGAPVDAARDPDLDFVNAGDLRRLQELGMVIGGHSRTHDNLTKCSAEELKAEMVDSSDHLSELAGCPIRYFSYPDGRFNAASREVARERFDAAFSTQNRYTAPDLWSYPRRSGDGVTDVRSVLSTWFPLKRQAIDAAKRALKY